MSNNLCPKTGKICHTKAAAKSLATWWRKNHFARMNSYKCPHCNTWHIGNDWRKPRRKRW